MNKVVKILMERDNMSELEAENLVDECREELEYAVNDGSWEEAECIMRDYLGLEMDYIWDIV